MVANVCGYYNSILTLKDQEWKCPDCKTRHDRDINVAINIKKFALLDQNLIGIWRMWNWGMSLGNFSQER